MTANSKLVVLAAALGFIPTYLYWLLVVQPPAKKKKMLQRIGGARAMLAAHELREAKVQFMEHHYLTVGSMTVSSAVNFEDLRSLLSKGTVRAQDVHALFRYRATLSHQMTHCLVGFIPEASTTAEKCDETIKAKKTVGVLHGIPISIKESIEVKGHACTIGLASRCAQMAEEDSAVVAAVKLAGGVPFCRTNIPQTNLSYGCSNPIFGETVNPYDARRTSGGSSGGEAALIATGGSIIGIGSDIGGSVRVPAAFCGVAGFKPTAGRIPSRGVASVVKGQTGVAGSIGIMAKEVSAIVTTMEAISALPTTVDPLYAPVPWDQFGDLSSTKKLRVGFYYADGFLPAIPANVRAVKEGCELLRSLGHEVVPFKPVDVISGIHLFLALLTADGASGTLAALQHETADASCKGFLDGVKLKNSAWASRSVPWKLRRKGMIRAAALFENHGITTVTNYWHMQGAKDEYRRRWCAAMDVAGIDVLLCPSHTMVAPAPEVVATSGLSLCYTQLFNLIDFPATTLPMGLATPEDEAKMEGWPMSVLREQFGSELDQLIQAGRVYGEQGDHLESVVKATCKGMAGLPLSVQVVGRPFKDEQVLRVARDLQGAAPPMTPPPVEASLGSMKMEGDDHVVVL